MSQDHPIAKRKGMLRRVMNMMVAAALLSVCGCTGGNYGVSSRNTAVDRIFRSGEMPSAYRYYYNGVKLEPVALLGLRKEYRLRSKFWTEIDLNAQQLKDWRAFFIESITWYDDRKHGRMAFAGYTLTDRQGKEVGILYSRYDWTVLEFPEDKVVVVHPPQPQVGNRLLMLPDTRKRPVD